MDNIQLGTAHRIFLWVTGIFLVFAAIPNSKVLWCLLFKCTQNAFSIVGMSLWAGVLAFLSGIVLLAFGLFSGYIFFQNREYVYRKYAIGSAIILSCIILFWLIVLFS